jgi:hypothetical protein
MYQMITLGGDAELELVDTLDPFSEVLLRPQRRWARARPLQPAPLMPHPNTRRQLTPPSPPQPHPNPAPRQGIVFSVRPPKKSWKHIANLSGGEKTLSSLALVFALHHYKPTPLYVMDEIDAALDFKNVSIGEPGFRSCFWGAGRRKREGGGQGGDRVYVMDETDAALDFKNVSIGGWLGPGLDPARTAPAPRQTHTQLLAAACRLLKLINPHPLTHHSRPLHQGAHPRRPVRHHLPPQQHV